MPVGTKEICILLLGTFYWPVKWLRPYWHKAYWCRVQEWSSFLTMQMPPSYWNPSL